MKETKNKEEYKTGSIHEMLDFKTKIKEAQVAKQIAKQIEEAQVAKQMKKAKLWCDVYVAYVGSSNSIRNNAYEWADKAVKEFEERFNQ